MYKVYLGRVQFFATERDASGRGRAERATRVSKGGVVAAPTGPKSSDRDADLKPASAHKMEGRNELVLRYNLTTSSRLNDDDIYVWTLPRLHRLENFSRREACMWACSCATGCPDRPRADPYELFETNDAGREALARGASGS